MKGKGISRLSILLIFWIRHTDKDKDNDKVKDVHYTLVDLDREKLRTTGVDHFNQSTQNKKIAGKYLHATRGTQDAATYFIADDAVVTLKVLLTIVFFYSVTPPTRCAQKIRYFTVILH